MKLLNTLLAVLLITLLSSPSWSMSLELLVDRDGLYYPKFSDVPFTGEVTGKSQGYLQNGKREGLWVGYWDDGQSYNKGTFKNGKQEGVWITYNDNGVLRSKDNYKDGVKIGD